MIGRIERQPLSSVWGREVMFSKWLEENIDYLDEVLGIGLTDAKREEGTGNFFCDLVAENGAGEHVVIENQYHASDHDHLGKLLTYFASLDAQVGVWIVEHARPEHASAVEWLNQSGLGRFYLLKAELLRIGVSEAAPMFTVMVEPSSQADAVGSTKRDLAERHKQRYEFWTQLLAVAGERSPLHRNLKPSYDTWINAGAGRSGLTYTYVANQHASAAELYIDRGADYDTWNAAVYAMFLGHKSEIEGEFGGPLLWDEKEGRRGRRIRCELPHGYRDFDRRSEVIEAMVDSMTRLELATRPFMSEVPA
jgi:hypothetical protein